MKDKHSLDAYQMTVTMPETKLFIDCSLSTIRCELNSKARKLGRITLRLFPEYAARGSEEPLDYEDRALVELLTDFTRVSEKSVSPQFWQRNIAVMDATIQLLSRTKLGPETTSQGVEEKRIR